MFRLAVFSVRKDVMHIATAQIVLPVRLGSFGCVQACTSTLELLHDLTASWMLLFQGTSILVHPAPLAKTCSL